MPPKSNSTRKTAASREIDAAEQGDLARDNDLDNLVGVYRASRNLNHCFGVADVGEAAKSHWEKDSKSQIKSNKVSSGYPVIRVGKFVEVSRSPHNPHTLHVRDSDNGNLIGAVSPKILREDYQRMD